MLWAAVTIFSPEYRSQPSKLSLALRRDLHTTFESRAIFAPGRYGAVFSPVILVPHTMRTLRQTEEWRHVDREIDIRLMREPEG